MAKFDQTLCEVCYEPLFNVEELPPEIQEKIYRPSEDGMIEDVDLQLQDKDKSPMRDGGWGMIGENGDDEI
jgi:hypothetical protein